jgi:hypothetical protein
MWAISVNGTAPYDLQPSIPCNQQSFTLRLSSHWPSSLSTRCAPSDIHLTSSPSFLASHFPVPSCNILSYDISYPVKSSQGWGMICAAPFLSLSLFFTITNRELPCTSPLKVDTTLPVIRIGWRENLSNVQRCTYCVEMNLLHCAVSRFAVSVRLGAHQIHDRYVTPI